MAEKEEVYFVKGIGIALIIVGSMGCLMGMMMFGDIGIACMVGSVGCILSGCGFLSASKQIQRLWSSKSNAA